MTTFPKTPGSTTPPAGSKVEFYRTKGAGRFGFFLMAVLLHLLLFFLVATWVIFAAPKQDAETSFQPVKGLPVKVPPPPDPSASGASASNPQAEPQPVIVPVTAPLHAITSVNVNFSVDTTKSMDQAMTHINLTQAAQGTGLDAAGAGGRSGTGSMYGSTTGSGQELVGQLYDLKQTPGRKATEFADPSDDHNGTTWNGLDFLRSFVKDWDLSTLDRFYKAPITLYATQIFIPERRSEESTKAFGVSDVVQAKRWVIVYNAKVTAPETGTFRFVGWADDFMVVRWNGDNVLDACYAGELLDPSARTDSAANRVHGKWIDMEAGVPVPLQILIGEGPGGFSGFLLSVQKKGAESTTGDDPVFQLADGPIPDLPDLGKGFTKKKMIFQPAP
jgi:hypothetical protein